MVHFRDFQTTAVIALLLATYFSEARAKKGKKFCPCEEQALTVKLLDRYNVLVRPVQKPSDLVTVSLGVTLIKVVHMNEALGTIICHIWLRLEWTDLNLKWNPTTNGNITKLSVPISRIWSPDIFPLNNAQESYSAMFDANAIIHSNGTVVHAAPYILHTTCEFKVGETLQMCPFKYGSWTLHALQLDLVVKDYGNDFSRYVANPNWELLGIRTETKAPFSHHPVIRLTYNLTLKQNAK